MVKVIPQIEKDGYRVRAKETANTLTIALVFVQNGKVEAKHEIWRINGSPESLISILPEWRRREKLLAALMRNINEGGDRLELNQCLDAVLEFVGTAGAETQLQVVAVESQESHVRTFLQADGSYLRIIEDEVAEELSPEEIQALIEDDDQDNEDEDIGQGII